MRWLMIPETPDVEEILAQLVNRPAWHRQAACRGMGPDPFFPMPGESTERARAVCETCPVTAECLDEALERPAVGVWGGTTGRGRRVLRRGAA